MGVLESVCTSGREHEAKNIEDMSSEDIGKVVRAAEAGAVASLLTQDIQQQRAEDGAGSKPGGGANGEAARARIRKALEECQRIQDEGDHAGVVERLTVVTKLDTFATCTTGIRASLLGTLAQSHAKLQQFQSSLQQYTVCLALLRSSPKPDGVKMARVMKSIAYVHLQMGNRAAAIAMCKEGEQVCLSLNAQKEAESFAFWRGRIMVDYEQGLAGRLPMTSPRSPNARGSRARGATPLSKKRSTKSARKRQIRRSRSPAAAPATAATAKPFLMI